MASPMIRTDNAKTLAHAEKIIEKADALAAAAKLLSEREPKIAAIAGLSQALAAYEKVRNGK